MNIKNFKILFFYIILVIGLTFSIPENGKIKKKTTKPLMCVISVNKKQYD